MTNSVHQPQPQPVYVQMVRPPSRNGIAIAGLILGIVACLFALIPLLGLVLFPVPGMLALIFGIVGIVNANKLGGLRIGAAIASVVLSLAPIAIFVVSYSLYTAR